MTIRYSTLAIFFLLSLNSFGQRNDISFTEEHTVINSVFDGILDLEYCNPILAPTEKAVPENTRYNNRHFFSQTALDSIPKFGIIYTDSQVSRDFKHQRDYLKKQIIDLIVDSLFFEEMEFMLTETPLNPDLIEKQGVELYTEEMALLKGLKPKELGKRDSVLNIGYLNFSRVFYSAKNNLGIFYYLYYGGQDCGYTAYVVFEKNRSAWVFKKIIHMGVF